MQEFPSSGLSGLIVSVLPEDRESGSLFAREMHVQRPAWFMRHGLGSAMTPWGGIFPEVIR